MHALKVFCFVIVTALSFNLNGQITIGTVPLTGNYTIDGNESGPNSTFITDVNDPSIVEWDPIDNSYLIHSSINISGDYTLNIINGVKIKFASSAHISVGSGQLNINGQEGSLVQLTSFDEISTWPGIVFGYLSGNYDKNSTLNYVEFSNAYKTGETSAKCSPVSIRDYGIVNITNSVFHSNHGSSGGVIFGRQAFINISNCLFENNESEREGGAIYHYTNTVLGGELSVQESIFSNNKAYSGHGGAIYAANLNDLSINRNTFEGNVNNGTNKYGGAVYITNIKSTSFPSISYNIFRNNKSSGHGGGFFISSTNTSFEISNNLVHNNSSVYGGAFDVRTSKSILRNNTICFNHGNNNGGIYTSGELYFGNNIVYGNTSVNSGLKHKSANFASNVYAEFNNIEHLNSLTGINTHPDDLPLNNINEIPDFINAPDHSGYSETEVYYTIANGEQISIYDFGLNQNSHSIDAGTNSSTMSNYTFSSIPNDLNGNTRSSGNFVDQGAIEVQVVSCPNEIVSNLYTTQNSNCSPDLGNGSIRAELSQEVINLGKSADDYSYDWTYTRSGGYTSQSSSNQFIDAVLSDDYNATLTISDANCSQTLSAMDLLVIRACNQEVVIDTQVDNCTNNEDGELTATFSNISGQYNVEITKDGLTILNEEKNSDQEMSLQSTLQGIGNYEIIVSWNFNGAEQFYKSTSFTVSECQACNPNFISGLTFAQNDNCDNNLPARGRISAIDVNGNFIDPNSNEYNLEWSILSENRNEYFNDNQLIGDRYTVTLTASQSSNPSCEQEMTNYFNIRRHCTSEFLLTYDLNECEDTLTVWTDNEGAIFDIYLYTLNQDGSENVISRYENVSHADAPFGFDLDGDQDYHIKAEIDRRFNYNYTALIKHVDINENYNSCCPSSIVDGLIVVPNIDCGTDPKGEIRPILNSSIQNSSDFSHTWSITSQNSNVEYTDNNDLFADVYAVNVTSTNNQNPACSQTYSNVVELGRDCNEEFGLSYTIDECAEKIYPSTQYEGGLFSLTLWYDNNGSWQQIGSFNNVYPGSSPFEFDLIGDQEYKLEAIYLDVNGNSISKEEDVIYTACCLMDIQPLSSSQASCYQTADGSVSLEMLRPGIGPYEIQWQTSDLEVNNSQTNISASDFNPNYFIDLLLPRDYTFTITDLGNPTCQNSFEITVEEAASPQCDFRRNEFGNPIYTVDVCTGEVTFELNCGVNEAQYRIYKTSRSSGEVINIHTMDSNSEGSIITKSLTGQGQEGDNEANDNLIGDYTIQLYDRCGQFLPTVTPINFSVEQTDINACYDGPKYELEALPWLSCDQKDGRFPLTLKVFDQAQLNDGIIGLDFAIELPNNDFQYELNSETFGSLTSNGTPITYINQVENVLYVTISFQDNGSFISGVASSGMNIITLWININASIEDQGLVPDNVTFKVINDINNPNSGIQESYILTEVKEEAIDAVVEIRKSTSYQPTFKTFDGDEIHGVEVRKTIQADTWNPIAEVNHQGETKVADISNVQQVHFTKSALTDTERLSFVNARDCEIMYYMTTFDQENLDLIFDTEEELLDAYAYMLISADVNMNGTVRSNDITLLQRRITNGISEIPQSWNYDETGVSNIATSSDFNSGSSLDWIFFDDRNDPRFSSVSFEFENHSNTSTWRDNVPNYNYHTDLTFLTDECELVDKDTLAAVLIGDVNGNYPNENVQRSLNNGKLVFDLSNAINTEENIYQIPVLFDASYEVTAFDFVMDYNIENIEFISLTKSAKAQSMNMNMLNNNQEGVLRHTSFSQTGGQGNQGLIYYLTVKVIDSKLDRYDLGNTTVYLNGAKATAEITDANDILSNSFEDTFIDLSVYPNPSTGEVSITYSGFSEDMTIHMVNSLGQQVHIDNSISDHKTNSYVVSDLTNGIYFISVHKNGAIIKTERLVVIN